MGCSVCKFVPPNPGDSRKFISNKNNNIWITPVTHTILGVPESPSSNFNFHHQAFSQNKSGKSVLLRSLTEANLQLQPYRREENTSNQRLDNISAPGVDRNLHKSFSTDLSTPLPEPAFATSTVIEKPKKTEVEWRPISDVAGSSRPIRNNNHSCIPTFCSLKSGPIVEAQMFVSRDEKGVARLVNKHVIHHPNSSKSSVEGEICIEITHKTPINAISTGKGASIAEGMPIYSSCLPNPQILDQLPKKYETPKNELIQVRDDIKPRRSKPKCSWRCAKLSPHSLRPSKCGHSKPCTKRQCCLMTPCCRSSAVDDKPCCKKKEKKTSSPKAKKFALFKRSPQNKSPYSYGQLPNVDNLRNKCHCEDGELIEYLKQLENIVLTRQKNPNHISLSSTVELLSVKRPPTSSSSPPPQSTTPPRREITNYDSTDNIQQQEQRHNASNLQVENRETDLTLNNQLIHPKTSSVGEKSNSSDYLDEENSSQCNVCDEQLNENLQLEQTNTIQQTKLNYPQNDQNPDSIPRKGYIPQNSCNRYTHRRPNDYLYPHHLHNHPHQHHHHHRHCYHNHNHHQQLHRHNHTFHTPFTSTNLNLPVIDQKQKIIKTMKEKLQTNKGSTSLNLPRLHKS
uniref:Uncharacterized protein n=1 Tax=Trichobilharzia regenti TaxID=157069 RepID=A0AA85KJG0_TRIRE|nr:unnamed protein product [Trichobilharzia regenti]